MSLTSFSLLELLYAISRVTDSFSMCSELDLVYVYGVAMAPFHTMRPRGDVLFNVDLAMGVFGLDTVPTYVLHLLCFRSFLSR